MKTERADNAIILHLERKEKIQPRDPFRWPIRVFSLEVLAALFLSTFPGHVPWVKIFFIFLGSLVLSIIAALILRQKTRKMCLEDIVKSTFPFILIDDRIDGRTTVIKIKTREKSPVEIVSVDEKTIIICNKSKNNTPPFA